MRRAIKLTAIAAICISLAIQTGCWDRKQYEEIGFMLQLGLETDQEGKLVYSLTYPIVAPEVKEKVEFLHTSSEKLLRSSREKLRNFSGKQVQSGKIQHIYFSKEMAEKGIGEFLEVFLREPENPLLANILIVEGSPKEMLELSTKYEHKPRSAFYVNGLLVDARRRSVIPETRVYNFSIRDYSNTIDPVVPLMRYDEKNIEIIGSALFNGDKMVGKLDTAQTMLLNGFMGDKGGGEYIYVGPDIKDRGDKIKEGAAMLVRNFKRKIKINTEGKVPVIDLSLDIKAFLDEYSEDYDLEDPEKKRELEEKIERSIQAESLSILQYIQGIGADPIGFGEIVRAYRNQYWKSVQWKEVYKEAVFNVDVDVNIQSYGVIK